MYVPRSLGLKIILYFTRVLEYLGFQHGVQDKTKKNVCALGLIEKRHLFSDE